MILIKVMMSMMTVMTVMTMMTMMFMMSMMIVLFIMTVMSGNSTVFTMTYFRFDPFDFKLSITVSWFYNFDLGFSTFTCILIGNMISTTNWLERVAIGSSLPCIKAYSN